MGNRRHSLSNEQFKRIGHLLPGKPGDPGAKAIDNRQFVEAVLHIIMTGTAWRDMPERFGNHERIYKRFNRFAKSGRWARIVAELSDYDFGELQIDSTIVRAHQHSAGKKKQCRSRSDRALARQSDDEDPRRLRQPGLPGITGSEPGQHQ